MTKISLMQGRLLPPYEGRFQAYPADGWEKEFTEGAKLGLHSIEWIYEKPHDNKNALSDDQGISHLKTVMKSTGVSVRSICADYYMTEHLIKDGHANLQNWHHLEWLLNQAKKIDVKYIILPFVDSSSLLTEQDRGTLSQMLQSFLRKNEYFGIEIHLEADLEPLDFKQLFDQVNHPLLKMNYDTGNSASLGYDPDSEFQYLGDYLGSVHIKDRLLKGKTVPLGYGNTDFTKCFKWFQTLKFNGWYVLQAARGDIGSESHNIASQINFVHQKLHNYES